MDVIEYPTECPDCNEKIGQFNAVFDYENNEYKCKDCMNVINDE